TRIVILDESTSSLDESTAAKINNYEFGAGTTILAVAHRIHSFLHFDRVIVLEEGRLVQDEPIKVAMNNVGSHFYNMYKEETTKLR
ncbi:MAG: hypothetical protein MHPSP_002657, partial [Paramarteilia canceri]